MSPVPLPGPGARLEAGTEVTILGWGKEADTGGVSPDLNYVQVPCWCSYRGLSSAHFPKVAAISDAACSAYYGPLGEGVGCVQGPSTCQVRATCQASRVTCPLRVTRAAPC